MTLPMVWFMVWCIVMRKRDYLREAATLVVSLLSDGYLLYWQSITDGKLAASLKHCRNGSRIVIYASAGGYIMKKNGRIVKQVGTVC